MTPKETKRSNPEGWKPLNWMEDEKYPTPEKLTAVININHNIAAGLRETPDSSQ